MKYILMILFVSLFKSHAYAEVKSYHSCEATDYSGAFVVINKGSKLLIALNIDSTEWYEAKYIKDNDVYDGDFSSREFDVRGLNIVNKEISTISLAPNAIYQTSKKTNMTFNFYRDHVNLKGKNFWVSARCVLIKN